MWVVVHGVQYIRGGCFSNYSPRQNKSCPAASKPLHLGEVPAMQAIGIVSCCEAYRGQSPKETLLPSGKQ